MKHDPATFDPLAPGLRSKDRPHGPVIANGEWEWEIVETQGYLAKTIAVLWRDPYTIYYENKRGDIGVKTTLTTPCPFCHQRHEHGIGDGHREPHCATSKVAASASLWDGITVYHKDGYVVRTRSNKSR